MDESLNCELLNQKLLQEPITIQTTALGDRMKQYENIHNSKIPTEHYYIIRLDGKNFSKFTKGFKKPFDSNFVRAMNNTQIDLLNKFNANTSYSHSDEITLIFNKCDVNLRQKHMFDGRIQKIISCVASYCSVRFNYHLNNIINNSEHKNEYPIKLLKIIESYEQIFDGRILSFENKNEITNHQIWRSVHDCNRNAILTYGHAFYSHSELHHKNCTEIIEMLKKHNINWSDIPLHIKHGIYCKKILYDLQTIEQHTNKEITCKRTKVISKAFKIEFSEEITNLLINSYWNDEIFNVGAEYNI